MYCNVLVNVNPMIGLDLHTALPPPMGLPFEPMFPHVTFGMLDVLPWGLISSSTNKVLCDGHKTMHKGTDIGFLIVHVPVPPIPHFLLPLENILTGSKSEWGVSSVQVGGSTVAVAVAVVVNLNLNCFGPACIIPGVGIVPTWTSVQANMTLADFRGGLVSAAIDWALQALANKIMGSKVSSKLFDRLTGPLVRKIAPGLMERLPKASMLISALHANGMNRYWSYIVGGLPSTLTGLFVVGTPLGFSAPWTVFGDDFAFTHTKPVQSLDDYLTSPSVPQYPSAPPATAPR